MSNSRAVQSLAKLITFQTVSVRGEPDANLEQFEGLRAYIKERYPNVFTHCTCERHGNSGLLLHLAGKTAVQPSALMAHYDVVDVSDGWQEPPFGGVIKDDVLWGRGAIDTKVTLCAILEAAETLLAEGYTPAHDLYLAFSGDEEIMGTSAPAIVDALAARGIRLAFVLDEGGAIVSGIFPGVDKDCAVIGIAEKGMADLMLSAASAAGHASSPPKITALGKISKAICRIEAHPFKQHLVGPVRSMLSYLGGHSKKGAIRLIFANLALTAPIVKLICRVSGGELAAMSRTTCAFTMAKGSSQANVLPKSACATTNLRILQGDTVESVMARIKRFAGSDITVTKVYSAEPSKISKLDDRYDLLADTIRENWRDMLVTPYLMMACSDSRHFCRISDNVYRFTPLGLSGEDRALIHADNERIATCKVDDCVEFYKKLIRKL
ncbi:MAG: M20/M25/M40 family metallo-hydrolase [Acetanaerobacterium sp.]